MSEGRERPARPALRYKHRTRFAAAGRVGSIELLGGAGLEAVHSNSHQLGSSELEEGPYGPLLAEVAWLRITVDSLGQERKARAEEVHVCDCCEDAGVAYGEPSKTDSQGPVVGQVGEDLR